MSIATYDRVIARRQPHGLSVSRRFTRLDFMARWMLASSMLTLFIAGVLLPGTVNSVLTASSQPIASLLLALFPIGALLVALDVLINDMLPERWTFRWARNKRFYIYWACGVICLLPTFVVSKDNPLTISAYLNLSTATFSFILCLRDVAARRRGAGL